MSKLPRPAQISGADREVLPQTPFTHRNTNPRAPKIRLT